MIPSWVFIPSLFGALLIGGGLGYLGTRFLAQSIADRVLDAELSLPRLNDQAAEDSVGSTDLGGGR